MKKRISAPIVIQVGLNLVTILIVASIIFAQRAQAAPATQTLVPGFLPYQGTLTDTTGNPLNGMIDMVFRLYAVPSSGTPMWEETHQGENGVPVTQGLFNVNLGSFTPLPADAWEIPQLYLGVQVGGDAELAPRQPVGGVPVALKANVADLALSVADASIQSRHFAPTRYDDFNPETVSNSTVTLIQTGESITFTCEVDCTAWIMHQGLVSHSVHGGRSDACIVVDGNCLVRELAVTQSNFGTLHGETFVDLDAGPHTVEIWFSTGYNSPGTSYYYGDASGSWEHLHVLTFAQP